MEQQISSSQKTRKYILRYTHIILFQCFIIEALTNSCGHFRTMPLSIKHLIEFIHGILHIVIIIFYIYLFFVVIL